MNVVFLQIVLLALLISGSGASDVRAGDNPTKAPEASAAIKKALGERTVGILTGATKVETFRLEGQKDRAQRNPRKEPAPKVAAPTIGCDQVQHTIAATGQERDQTFAVKVCGLLFDEVTDPEPYDHAEGPFGLYADVAFRFWKEKESVTVIVHFDDWVFLVVTRDAGGKQTKVAIGEFLSVNRKKRTIEKGDLFARTKALALEAFPTDEKLKALTIPAAEDVIRPSVGDTVPEPLLAALEKGEPFELLSLDPTRLKQKPENDFHGYKVLGKTTVKDAGDRKKLVVALKQGVEDNDGGAAGCFNPRHGIRVVHDKKTIDFVICFECLFVYVYVDGKPAEKGLRTTGSPKKAFDAALKAAKVPLPEK